MHRSDAWGSNRLLKHAAETARASVPLQLFSCKQTDLPWTRHTSNMPTRPFVAISTRKTVVIEYVFNWYKAFHSVATKRLRRSEWAPDDGLWRTWQGWCRKRRGVGPTTGCNGPAHGGTTDKASRRPLHTPWYSNKSSDITFHNYFCNWSSFCSAFYTPTRTSWL